MVYNFVYSGYTTFGHTNSAILCLIHMSSQICRNTSLYYKQFLLGSRHKFYFLDVLSVSHSTYVMWITCSCIIQIKPSVFLFNSLLTSYLQFATFFWWGFLMLQKFTFTSFFHPFLITSPFSQIRTISQWEHIPHSDLKFDPGSSQSNFFPSCSLLYCMFLFHDMPDCSQAL